MNPFVRLSLVLWVGLFSGCSSFQRKWDAVGKPGRYRDASRWEGRWTSARHRNAANVPEGGRLRCVMEHRADSRILAHFHANWQLFAADYEVPFEPKRQGPRQPGEALEFRGTHELTKLFGGTHRYEARMKGNQFSARYDSSYDSGKFEMTRQLTSATPIH